VQGDALARKNHAATAMPHRSINIVMDLGGTEAHDAIKTRHNEVARTHFPALMRPPSGNEAICAAP
jgi:hypothetical protein